MKTRLAALALLTACAGSAQAHSGDVLAGVAVGTVIGSAIHSPGVSITYGYGYPYGVYAPPRVVYSPPVYPPHVIYGPVYGPSYGPSYGYGWGHKHDHHRGWGGHGHGHGNGHGHGRGHGHR